MEESNARLKKFLWKTTTDLDNLMDAVPILYSWGEIQHVQNIS